MMELEKVIKGLEKIAEFFKARGDMAVGDGKMLLLSWMRAAEDAIALLKAQEPRVMTPEDFDGNPDVDSEGRLPAWRELNRGDKPSLVADGYCTITEEEMKLWDPLFVRWWTSRPADEQREATPWES